MRPVDGRLEQLLGPGAAVLTAMLDLVPDPIGILWAIRDADGTVTDSGIGLAVCRKIVEAHGGAIAAQRADGGGTIMRFSLPVSTARVAVPAP